VVIIGALSASGPQALDVEKPVFDFSPGYTDLSLNFILKSIIYYAILFASGVGLAGWIARHSGLTDRWQVSALGCALGPILYAWLVTMMLRYLPGLRPEFYLAGGLFPLLSGLFFWRSLLRSRTLLAPDEDPAHPVWNYAVVPVIIIACAAVGLSSVLPLHGNDPLEYGTVARLIANARSVAAYPFANPENGFYGPWTHPPGYPVTLVIGYFVQGHTETAGVIRIAASYYMLAMIFLVATLAHSMRPGTGYVAALLLLATPLLLHLVIQNHVDAMRMAAFAACALLLVAFCKAPTIRLAVLLGIGSGLSHFCHSIGLITPLLLLPAFIMLAPISLLQRIGLALVCILTFLPVTAPFMLDNLRLYGAILADAVPIWKLPEIPIHDYLAATRDLDGLWAMIVFGLLKGFTFIGDFGLVYWISLTCFIVIFIQFSLKRTNSLRSRIDFRRGVTEAAIDICSWLKRTTMGKPGIPSAMTVVVTVLATFYGLALTTVLLDSTLIVKNSRYILTPQPLVAAIGAVLVTRAAACIAPHGLKVPFRELWKAIWVIFSNLRGVRHG
jgi:hypothetical protein